MKLSESFWWEYYGSDLIGGRHPHRRKFKYTSLWLVIALTWCAAITAWVIFK